jgi:hypothetical protein
MISEAAAWFDLGCSLQDAQRYQGALEAFEQAQAVDPTFPSLRNRIAWVHLLLGNFTTSLNLSESLVRDTPRDMEAWTLISASAYMLRQWDKSLAAAERAFQINPNDSAQLYRYSLVLGEFGRFKRARYLLNRAVCLTPRDTLLHVQLGLMQLAEGDFKNGWKTFESRWELGDPLANAPIPRWQGESLAQKILFIWNEPWHGHGDSILFLRYAPSLAERAQREGGLIILYCREPLHTLFTRGLVEYYNELCVTTVAERIEWQPHHFLGTKQLQCSLSSLPLWAGDAIPAKFPYLTPDPTKTDLWRKRLLSDKNFKIGLSWTGRADHARNDLRSVPVLDLVQALKKSRASRFIRFSSANPTSLKRRKRPA